MLFNYLSSLSGSPGSAPFPTGINLLSTSGQWLGAGWTRVFALPNLKYCGRKRWLLCLGRVLLHNEVLVPSFSWECWDLFPLESGLESVRSLPLCMAAVDGEVCTFPGVER